MGVEGLWPEPPAIWRRIRLTPGPSSIEALLEDTFHRFSLTMRHADGVVAAVEADALRYPWSTCAEAPARLAAEVAGRPLAEVALVDASQHCTHLLDMLALCAAHAGDPASLQYDMVASEPVEGRKSAALLIDGRPVLDWRLDGTTITAPDAWAGRDLRKFSAWRGELDAATARQVPMLRRISLMADQQAGAPEMARLSEVTMIRMGACFTYQPERAAEARSMRSRRGFTPGTDEPLAS
jgi:hypothetical protein